MSMYSFLQENPTPTAKEIEARFDGNLCRCTGYRPILTAMKTFASDQEKLPTCQKPLLDIEDVCVARPPDFPGKDQADFFHISRLRPFEVPANTS